MRGKSAKNERSGYRLRLAGTAGGIGAAAVVAIMALSAVASAGVASPAAFKGAVWNGSVYKDLSGCVTNKGPQPKWSALTGIGHMMASTAAKTCPKAKGGSTFGSYSYDSAQLTVYAPVKMPTGTGGVNVSWSIVATSSTTGGIGASWACPTTTYAYSYNYGYTWYNFTDVYGYCSAMGSANIYGFAYVHDLTTGTWTYPSNYWSSPYNTSGQINDTYMYSATYSNSSYWAYNYSYSGSYNYSYGASGSFAATSNMAPQWFINGTFVHTDKYIVETYLDVYCDSSVSGFKSGHASAAVNAASGANHADLMPFSVW